jgi:hypothetical protein
MYAFLLNNVVYCIKIKNYSKTYFNLKYLWKYVLWRIYAMKELLRHRGLGARARRESCGLDQRVAR